MSPPGTLPPFLQPQHWVPLCWLKLPSRCRSHGLQWALGCAHSHTPPVRIPGDPIHVPTALVSPWPLCVSLWPRCASPRPWCNSPDPLALSPHPPGVPLCPLHMSPSSHACPYSPRHGTGMGGGCRSPHPKQAASRRVGGPGDTQGVGEHLGGLGSTWMGRGPTAARPTPWG